MKITALAKVNAFLKITGKRDGYHTLRSRFVRVDDLYDTIRFVPEACSTFTIEGLEGVPREANTIYKAYKALNEATGDLDVLDFFYRHKVVVTKRIPAGAGLGGGSSDAGAFLRLVHRVCDLRLSIDELAAIGARVGADVPFFVYDYPSANVSGIGEVVEPFDELTPPLEIVTPPIHCDTAAVYRRFSECCANTIDPDAGAEWFSLPTREILNTVKDPTELNDLFRPARDLCPGLKKYAKEGWFFSGSGSSFFRLRG